MADHVTYDITTEIGYGRQGRELLPEWLNLAPTGRDRERLEQGERISSQAGSDDRGLDS
jgi:hypothetical protein